MSRVKVPPTGPWDADLMVVGEAPGREEESGGEPFIGDSGRLLDAMFIDAGIKRSEVFITNVLRYRPPGNKFNAAHPNDVNKGIRELRGEIKRVNPRVVIALGNEALEVLTGKRGIELRAGSIYPCLWDEKVLVIGAMHPSGILRGKWKPWRQLNPVFFKRARRIVEDGWEEQKRNHNIERSFNYCIQSLAEIQKSSSISFDIETRPNLLGPNNVVCLGFATSRTDAISIPITYGRRNYFTLTEEVDIWVEVAQILENPEIEKIIQNAMFDVTMIARWHGICIANVFDTQIAQNVLYPEMEKGLDDLVQLYTMRPYYKDMRKGSGDERTLWEYNCEDCTSTFEVAEAQKALLSSRGLWEHYNERMSYYPSLMYMALRGMRFDEEARGRLKEEYYAKIFEAEKSLVEIVGFHLNVNSSKQVGEYLYDVLGMKERKKRGTGNRTTDEDALLELRRTSLKKHQKILDKIISLRKLHKMWGTYIEMDTDLHDNRLRCSFNLAGTETGRISTSKSHFGGGMNTQNQPNNQDSDKDIRKLFVPDEGMQLGKCDLEKAEVYVVAYLSGDEETIEILKNGKDIHSHNASLIFHKPIEDISKKERHLGKLAKHAVNYGLTWKGLIQNCLKEGIYLTAGEAKEIITNSKKASPLLEEWQEWVRRELGKKKKLTTPLGMVRYFGGRLKGDPYATSKTYNEAFAFVPQSVVGELCLRAGRRIFDWGEVEILLSVHDEVVYQFEELNQAKRARELMEEDVEVRDMFGVSRTMRIPASLEVGSSWGDMEVV